MCRWRLECEANKMRRGRGSMHASLQTVECNNMYSRLPLADTNYVMQSRPDAIGVPRPEYEYRTAKPKPTPSYNIQLDAPYLQFKILTDLDIDFSSGLLLLI